MLNDRKGRHKVCCFTGHRKFNTPIEALNANLENIIAELYNDGIRYFCTGGALGFDTVAAKKILSMKENFNDIKLVLVLPCKDQTKMWNNADTKTRQRYYKERKLQTNITDKYRCKNHQQNTGKQNPATHLKDHTPWSSGIYPKDARILQYTQINQCDTPY